MRKLNVRALRARLLAIPAAFVATVGPAFAAVPQDVTTAVADMKADGLAVATAVLVAIIAVKAIKFIRSGM